MPRATNNIEDITRLDLKSCPGGFVELRRMTYGQYLQRQQMMMDMQMQSAGKGGGTTMDISMAQQKVAEFEFRHCIASHNLTDADDQSLDFKLAFTLQILDPRVGQEIGEEIDKIHNFEESEGN